MQVDLFEIKQAFQETYNKTLNKVIEGDTSGDYRKLLLAIVGDENMTISDLPPSQPAAEAQPGSEEPATAHEEVRVGSSYVGSMIHVAMFNWTAWIVGKHVNNIRDRQRGIGLRGLHPSCRKV